jgi:CDP-diacylglycerol--glycerol-3-phosphate 3-phosphatidyltransferase
VSNRHVRLTPSTIGVPPLAALVLAVVLYPVLPGGMAHWLVHPAALAGLCWAGQLWYVGYSDVASNALGLANVITVFRGGLYAVVAGFVLVPAGTLAWVPAACYGVGVTLDFVDGTVARTVGKETDLGARLDMAFDTFGFVVAPLVAVTWDLLPVWYLAISAARYVFVGSLRWRRFRGRHVYPLPDSDLGKYLAGVQMAFITVALVPATPTDLVFAVAPFVLAPSLAVFGRDFLVASGRVGWE